MIFIGNVIDVSGLLSKSKNRCVVCLVRRVRQVRMLGRS